MKARARSGRRWLCGKQVKRSCAILDLAAVGPDEAIILCPANHSPPSPVALSLAPAGGVIRCALGGGKLTLTVEGAR